MLSVSLADAPVQMRVFHIGVVVVGGFLPCGIRWVADNHANIQRLLPFAAFAVIFHCAVQQVVFFVHLEGIGEADTVKRRVLAAVGCIPANMGLDNAVIGRFDIDGSDVVGEQDNFIGVDFILVFFRQPPGGNDAALQQAGNESSRPGKGVKDMYAFILQTAVKFAAQDVFHTPDNEIDDFHRGINDAEAFGHLRKGIAEEFVVEFNDNFLLAFNAFNPGSAQLHGIIKRFEGIALLVQVFGFQQFDDFLHGETDRIVFGKAVVGKKGIEYRFGNQVLCQHFNNLAISDGVVQIIAQFGSKGSKGFPLGMMVWMLQNSVNTVDMGLRNFGDVAGPVFPMVAVAAFFDNFCIEGALNFANFKLKQRGLGIRIRYSVHFANSVAATRLFDYFFAFAWPFLFCLYFVGNGDDFHFLRVFAVNFQLVNHRVKAVIM